MSCTNIPTTFCTERPFPSFTVSVPKEHEAEIALTITDGHGSKVNTEVDFSKLVYLKQNNNETVSYTISGMIFRKVSSKCAGHFKIFVKVGNYIFKSGKITIVSCNTFNRQRKVKQGLTPTDSIELLPYIGREYKTRLNGFGFKTIKDLALLHESLHKERSMATRNVWEKVSHAGGILTLNRFFRVVDISYNLCKNQAMSTQKRRTVLPPLSSLNLPTF